ncbi:MAG: hypothetical protein O6923_06910, partial [Actinobacteria bacterium]|nr:hypothetical protein [Actinomycetota bacterium]
MRQPHIYALSAALLLTIALLFVVVGDPTPESGPVDTSPALAGEVASTTTTMDLDLSDGVTKPQVLSEVEVALIQEAANTSTTTTVTIVTTTTAPAKESSTSAPTTTAPAATTTQAPSPKGEFRSDYESDFHGRINSLRGSNGLAALVRNGSLDARARDWAKTMAESGSLKHSNIGWLVPPWSAAAENVGKGGSVSSIFGLL